MAKGKRSLLAQREKLVKELEKNQEMIRAYAIERRCGKAGCKCQTEAGYRHKPVWCFHDKEKGRIKAQYIPEKHVVRVKRQAQQYKNYKTIGAAILQINRHLLELEIKKGK